MDIVIALRSLRAELERKSLAFLRASKKIEEALQEVGEVPGIERTETAELTNREKELFSLFGQGLTTAEIASKLKRKQKTVEAHRDNLRKKLGIKSSHELTRIAIEKTHGGKT